MRIFFVISLYFGMFFLVLVGRSILHDGAFDDHIADGEKERKTNYSLQLHFYERRPYYIRYNDYVYGVIAQPIASMLNKMNISFNWVETPISKQLELIRENREPICAVGWFNTPERQEYAKFTRQIYRDGPLIALTRVMDRRIEDSGSLDRVLADSNLRLLLKNGYFYGSYVEDRLHEYNPSILKTNTSNIGMMEMVVNGRADYMLITEVEADDLLVHSSIDRNDFRKVHFKDVPLGNRRYLICSNMVGDDMIERINDGIVRFLDISGDIRYP